MALAQGIPAFLVLILVILAACLIGLILLAAIVFGIIMIIGSRKKKEAEETVAS